MNYPSVVNPLGANAPAHEILLAETAILVELPPTHHRLAVERYEAVRKHIEREGSPLYGKVSVFYPQGSMAIRATIRARRRDNGYDIDIVAELLLPAWMSPVEILNLLFEAINGPEGSIYHGKVIRQTRCVTVEYADGMHLDVTPSILLDEHDPRKSHIFHAKPEETANDHKRLIMNSFAFVEHFNDRTPIDLSFAEAYAKRASLFHSKMARAEAEVHPVPNHSSQEGGKSVTVVALQLLKRNRNVRYEKRKNLRMPPSVMLSKLAADVAPAGSSISKALNMIATHILRTLEIAAAKGRLVDIRNPICNDDCFTDRWPETVDAQAIYIEDLRLFQRKLAMLCSSQLSLEDMKRLLSEMFGEGPAQTVVAEYAERQGYSVRNNTRVFGPGGPVLSVGIAAPAITTSTPAATKPHTFYAPWRVR